MFEILVTSSLLILVITMLRRLWRNRLSPVCSYILWLMVAVRLLVPIPVFGNAFSVMNIVNGMVNSAEKWVQNRERSDRAEASGVGYKADGVSGKTAAAEVVVPAGLTGKGTESGKNEAAAAETESLSGMASEPFSEGDGRWRNAASGIHLQSDFSVGMLARRIWYAGTGVIAAGMLALNGVFRCRLYRGRRLLCRRGRIRVYVAEELDSPCLCGLFRPAVYVTSDCLLTERRLEHAVVHELTHYRHKDHIWILVRSLCAVIYWFDPFVWLAVYLSSKDCELACDVGTIRSLGEGQREAYGRTLIEMASASAGRMRILRCATDLSCRKKELKERITMIAGGKKKMGLRAALPVLCALLLAACTFGGAREEAAKGGYAESIVKLPVSTVFVDFVQGREGIRLIDTYGKDYISTDDGESFVPAEHIPNADRALRAGVMGLKGGPDGSRIFLEYGEEKKWRMVAADGKMTELEKVAGEEFYPRFYYGAGCFYTMNGQDIYRTDSVTGETDFVMECAGYPSYMAADEKMLYIVTAKGLVLYDLEGEETAPQQDEVLSNFVGAREDVLLYPCDVGIYVVTHEGIYRHELYGDSVECLMDGEMCGLGNRDRELLGMAVVQAGEKDAFLVYCSDGTLLRYDYDEDLVPQKEVLRVYSVYEDGNIRRAVTMFREKYPEIPIKYEVAIRSGYGITLEDALKNLSTELAAGKGPDILVMDDIQYSSYLQKGVLAELSSVREQMTAETHFISIIDAVNAETSGSEEGIYMVPLAFVVPVLAGDNEALEGVQSLTELADLLAETGKEGGSVIGAVNAGEVLSLLAQSSMGAWISADGGIDREALTEFMTQAKRIYDVQMKGVPEELRGRVIGKPEEETILARRFGIWGMGEASNAAYNKFELFPEQPFYAGYLGEYIAEFNGYLQIDEKTYCLMPGQRYASCMPLSMTAVNNASEAKEESLLFLEYALSEEFQGKAPLKGLPINRAAYLKKQEDPDEAGSGEPYTYIRMEPEKDGGRLYEVYWPDETVFGKLDEMIEGIRDVNLCEGRVYEEVLQQGEKVLTGSLSVEEGVDAVENALQIYLAE